MLLSLLFPLVSDARAQFTKTDYLVGDGPTTPIFADLDGDADQDLAATNTRSDNVSIMENASGRFNAIAGSAFSVGDSPVGIAAADFDGDGNVDLATANEGNAIDPDGNVTMLQSDGSFGFTSQTVPNSVTGADPYGIVAADLDGDTDVDLAVTNRTKSGNVTVLRNDGSGNFTRADQVDVGNQPRLIAAADFNDDGSLDLASANNADDSVSILENTTSTVGLPDFTSTIAEAVGDGPSDVIAADLTGDGQTDLAVTNTTDNTISILENTSTAPGALSFSETTEGVGARPFGITPGQFDRQVGTDLAVSNNDDGDVSFLLNDGAGDFTRFGSDQPVGNSPFGIVGADLNDDAIIDLAVANLSDDDVSVLESSEPFPVELAGDFSGAADASDVVLTWTTLSETNNDHFRILQKKNDAFVEVGTEPSQGAGGTTNEATHYRHRVENVAPGRHVFRLVQVDTDSDEHFGAETIVEVSLNETYRLSKVYPNPAPGTARLTLTVRQPQSVRVEVFDVLGRRVRLLRERPMAANEVKTFRVEGASLASGTYLIRVTGDAFSAVRRVVLMR